MLKWIFRDFPKKIAENEICNNNKNSDVCYESIHAQNVKIYFWLLIWLSLKKFFVLEVSDILYNNIQLLNTIKWRLLTLFSIVTHECSLRPHFSQRSAHTGTRKIISEGSRWFLHMQQRVSTCWYPFPV